MDKFKKQMDKYKKTMIKLNDIKLDYPESFKDKIIQLLPELEKSVRTGEYKIGQHLSCWAKTIQLDHIITNLKANKIRKLLARAERMALAHTLHYEWLDIRNASKEYQSYRRQKLDR